MSTLLATDSPLPKITKVYEVLYNEFKATGQGLNELIEAFTDDLLLLGENPTYFRQISSNELLALAEWGTIFDDNQIIETSNGEYFKWFEYENCPEEDFEYRPLDLEFDEHGGMISWEIN